MNRSLLAYRDADMEREIAEGIKKREREFDQKERELAKRAKELADEIERKEKELADEAKRKEKELAERERKLVEGKKLLREREGLVGKKMG